MKLFTFLSLMLCATFAMAQFALPIDFESTTATDTFENFSGGMTTIIPNAQMSGINTSANVAEMVKGAGDPWGGSFLTLDNPIDFSTNRTFKMKVFSPRAGARVLLKVEHLTDGAIFFQVEDTLSVANDWEELSFDFGWISLTNQYSKVVIIFDIGVSGDGSANFTFLMDDIALVDEGPYPSPLDLPVTFDDTTVDYTLRDFGGNLSSVVMDPAGGNNRVAKTIKTLGAATWAGTTLSEAERGPLSSQIPVTATETKMNVRVYSPIAGIQVRFKIEDSSDPTRSVETEATTTVVNTWETLEFDFSNEAPGTAALNLGYTFDMASIFFYFGKEGIEIGSDSVFYWDDVRFGPATTGIEDLADLGVSFSPNPVKDNLFIQTEQRMDEVSVYNVLGKKVMNIAAEGNKETLDFSSLTMGVYVVKVKVGNRVGVVKVVKD